MSGPFHPDYGYTDSFRLTVCKTAVKTGKTSAARKHGVSLTSVYVWIKVYNFDTITRA